MARALERVPLVALALAIVTAPIAWGGTRPAALLAIALVLGIGLVVLLAGSRPSPAPWRAIPLLVLATLVLPAVQLVPLPDPLVGLLSPRLLEEARASLAAGGEDPALAAAETTLIERAGGKRATPRARPLSVDPDSTRAGGLRLALGIAAFLLAAGSCADRRQRRLLCFALAGTAFFQAIFGLADHFAGQALLPAFDRPHDYGLPSGTFVNPNHFAALLSLGLFAAGALLASRRPARSGEAPVRATGAGRARLIVFGTAGAIVLLAMVWTSSRAGLAAAALGLAVLAARELVGRQERLLRSGALLLGIVAATLLGAAFWLRPPQPLVDDLGTLDVSWSWRFAVYRMAGGAMFPAFWKTGSGVGTFPRLEPLFRPAAMGRPAVHAHSDWLEWLVEGGVPGALLALAWLVLMVLAVRHLLRDGPDRAATAWLAAGGLALLAHAAIDFPLQLPGVMIPAAALAGAVLAPLGHGPRRTASAAPGSAERWFVVAIGAGLLGLVGFGAWQTLALRPAPDSLDTGRRRAAARQVIGSIVARLPEASSPEVRDALAGRAAEAVRTLQALAVRAPLRGEIRLSQHAGLRTFAALELMAGRTLPEGWDALGRYYLDRAEQLAPTSRARLRQIVRYRLAAGDRDEAARVARRLLEMEPAQAEIVYATLAREGAGDLAGLMAATPNRPDNAVRLARHLVSRNDPAGAQIVLERALARHPRDAALTIELASVLRRRGRHDAALELLERLEEPSDPALAQRAAALRAWLLARSGGADALERLDLGAGTGTAKDPASASEARARARLLADEGRIDDAVAVLEAALERRRPPLLVRERLALLVELARLFEREGRYRKALETYRRAQAIDPDDPAVRRFLERLDRAR